MIADFYIMCHNCPKPAVWEYGPSTERKDIYFCDDCVPRGCSCNVKDYNDPNSPQETDEFGRFLPCVEYWYYERGCLKLDE